MRKINIIEGAIFSSRHYGNFSIEKINNCDEVFIKFIETGFILKTTYKEIRTGAVKDPFFPYFGGVGYIGVGVHSPTHVINGEKRNTSAYEVWSGMIKRCYDERSKSHHRYKDCIVCDEWHNFQNYADWYYENLQGENWHVDKDLLVVGNRVYSPETCRFVPSEINSLFTGSSSMKGVHFCKNKRKYVAQIQKGELSKGDKKRQSYLGSFDKIDDAISAYDTAKCKHVKEVVQRYFGKIDPVIYDNLVNKTMSYITHYRNL